MGVETPSLLHGDNCAPVIFDAGCMVTISKEFGRMTALLQKQKEDMQYQKNVDRLIAMDMNQVCAAS